MRTIGAALTAAALIVSTVANAAAPLPAGKPAGVQKAQIAGPAGLLLLGTGILVAGIVLTTTKAGGNGVTTPSTTSTSTSGLP